MLDLELVRHEPERVKALVAARGMRVDVDALLAVDSEYRTATQELDELNKEQKQLNRQVATGEITPEEGGRRRARAKELEVRTRELADGRDALLAQLPNLMADDTPPGETDDDNVELRRWGTAPDIDPEKARHDTIGVSWGWYDATKGAAVAQSGYLYWLGGAAELLWSLYDATLGMLRRRGFEQVFTPVLAKDETFFATGYLPFSSDQLYRLEGEPLSLIGTSEQTMLGLFFNETVAGDELPRRLMAFSPCFRTEAGAAGSKTRGAFRVHQFHKVEQIVVCAPDESDALLDECQRNIEDLLQALEVPHRVVRTCIGDLGAPAYKKYDTETWFAGFGEYRETHSNSDLWDFQARRLRLRTKTDAGRAFPHTISATAATDRLFIALFEDLLARGFDAEGALEEGRRRIDAVRAL
ncbi:MAG: seryl-tRNA synthetase [Actinomycetota bacterium]|nr:seryl-tRNA synthetase [Actinomycetota bacterium]